ncbi:DUF3299 domain-containing protein [uncultured Sphingomonas sp.]|uniref:DUF3299 domain-containing protein n=1 Tax=uncultured Sphingomonas sp. TaxID=158754 RepID=UPI0035CB73C5
MRGKRAAIAMALALASGAEALAQQAPGERQAQARLPQGRSPLWGVLRTTRINVDEARGIFTASHPAAVKALVGKRVTLAGFVMPLDSATRGTHFLLSKYTPVCAFCPPGEPNEVVEVHTVRPLVFNAKLVNVTGTFGLENNGENGLFFQMASATVQ